MIFCLGSGRHRAYNPPAMTRTQIEKSVYVFTFLLIVAFCFALYKLALQVGIIG